MIWHHLTIT